VAGGDRWPVEFRTLVVLGESTVQGGEWLERREYRFADVLAGLIDAVQQRPVQYLNRGIGANVISPRSPGYADSVKPSALERFRADVIESRPDLFVLCYGLNDMRAGMHPEQFREDMQTVVGEVQAACRPLTVLTTVYHMTAYRSWKPFDRGSPELTELYNTVIRQLAERNGCLLADVWEAEGRADWLIHPDGVHANRVGNLLIAHRVFEAIAVHASGLAEATHARDAATRWTASTTEARAGAGDPFRRGWEAR
jgi:lysophospholipase L1-like esterase